MAWLPGRWATVRLLAAVVAVVRRGHVACWIPTSRPVQFPLPLAMLIADGSVQGEAT